MDFGKALRVMKQGGKVGREGWINREHGKHHMEIDEGILTDVMVGGFKPSYVAMGSEDLLAEDWVEVR
jgi:hypothetical protein